MFKKLVRPIQTVTVQGQDIDLHGLTMEDIAEVIEALPDDVLNLVGTAKDLNIGRLITKFPKVSAMILVKSARVPEEDIEESMEGILSMGFAHKVMCMKAVWDLSVPDEAALDALKNVGGSLYRQVQKLGADSLDRTPGKEQEPGPVLPQNSKP